MVESNLRIGDMVCIKNKERTSHLVFTIEAIANHQLIFREAYGAYPIEYFEKIRDSKEEIIKDERNKNDI